MINFDLTEKGFDKRNTIQYQLFVHVSIDSLSFMVLDKQNQVLSIRKHDFPEKEETYSKATQLESIILKEVFLQEAYQSVMISFYNEKCTLVPSRLFNSEEKSIYLKNIIPFSEEDKYFADDLSFINAQNVYAIAADILKVVQTYFSGAKLIHSSSALLQQFYEKAINDKGAQIYVNVGRGFFQGFFFQEGELIFYNTFTYTSSKDFIYHVMLIFDQFHIDPKDAPLFLSGEIMEDSEVYHLLYKYVRQITILEAPQSVELSAQWENRPKHWFFELYGLTTYSLEKV